MFINHVWTTLAVLDKRVVIRVHASETKMQEYVSTVSGPVTIFSPKFEIEIPEPATVRKEKMNVK